MPPNSRLTAASDPLRPTASLGGGGRTTGSLLPAPCSVRLVREPGSSNIAERVAAPGGHAAWGPPRKWRQPACPAFQSKPNVPAPPGTPRLPMPWLADPGRRPQMGGQASKAILYRLALFFFFLISIFLRFAMQGLLDPLLLETLERGLGAGCGSSGVSWTTHCFSPGTTRCHSPGASCPPPGS